MKGYIHLLIHFYVSISQVPFIAMYRKEDIPTLVRETDHQGGEFENEDDNRQPKMRWHKACEIFES